MEYNLSMTNTQVIKKLEQIAGKNNVLSEKEDCYPYAFDVTKVIEETSIPNFVVLPENKFQVQEIVKFASKNQISIVPRGAGTNQVGGCIPTKKVL